MNFEMFDFKKNNKIIIAGAAALVILIAATVFVPKNKTSKSQKEFSESEYLADLERQMEQLISNIDGAGNSKVLLTLDCGYEYIYADSENKSANSSDDSGEGIKRQENSSQNEQSYLLVRGSDGSEQPVLLKRVEPKVRGAVVMCDGADDQAVTEKITGAVRSALSLPANKISIIKLSRRNNKL